MRHLLAALLALALIPAACFADPISSLPTASTPDGTELAVIVQGGINKKITLSNMAAVASALSLQKAANLSDLNNAASARTNLGLGAAATQPLSAFLQPGNNLSEITSATSARQVLKLPVVATSYAGVDPTGVTDSTTGLANALTAASGATLVLPAGTYLASAFNIPANTQVLGAGQGITTIKRLSAATRNDTSPLVQVASGDDFESATVDLNSPGYSGGGAYNSMSGIAPALNASTTNVSIRHVAILNSGFYGIGFNDASNATHTGARIDDVTITGSAWVGALLRGIRNGSTTRLNVASSGYDAVEVESDSNFVLSQFRIDKSASPPIIPAESNNSAAVTSGSQAITGSGSINFTAPAGLTWTAGQAIYVYSGTGSPNYIYGTITSYNSGTGALVVGATSSGGSGTFTSWTGVVETGMLIMRGVRNANTILADGVANDNRHSGLFGDGIGVGENGSNSTSTLTPGTGAKTFAITPTCATSFTTTSPAYEVTAFSKATPLTKWMRGTIASCSGSTLIVNVTQATGGSASDWSINSEPGPEIISGVTVSYAGLFGIDLQSNDTLIGAEIDYSGSRGLNIGLDLGGRLSNVSASNVRVLDVLAGPGVYFGDGLALQSLENINLSHITVLDDQATKTTTYGVEVNGTAATQAYSNVTLDNSNSYYSQVLTLPYFEFGTDNVRLDGSLKAFATTATWTGGTPTGYTFGGGACPGATCIIHWDDHGSGKTRYINIQIAEGTVSGTSALSISLPFTIGALEGCTISGIDATNNTNVLGYAPAGGTSMNIVPSAFTTAHGLALAGTCQVQ